MGCLFQVILPSFSIPDHHMHELNHLEETSGVSHRVIDLDRCQKSIDSNLPDGYKLEKAAAANRFPMARLGGKGLAQQQQHLERSAAVVAMGGKLRTLA